jgi:hypothetical protein
VETPRYLFTKSDNIVVTGLVKLRLTDLIEDRITRPRASLQKRN